MRGVRGVRGESRCHFVRSVSGPRFHSNSVRAIRRTVDGRLGLLLDGVRGIAGPVEFFENMAVKKEGAVAGFVGVTVALLLLGRINGDCASPVGRSVGESNELALKGIVTVQACTWLSRLRWGLLSISNIY